MIKISVLPFLGIVASLAIQAVGMWPVKDHSIVNVFNWLVVGFGTWHWVRLIRFYLKGEVSWLGLRKPILIAILKTLVYWAAITFVAVGAILLAWIVEEVILSIASGIGDQRFLETTSQLTKLATVVFVSWVVCRFAIGIPAVSIDESPRFFADLWGISRGVSWSYAWRMILAGVLAFVVTTLAVLLYKFIAFGDAGLAGIQYSSLGSAIGSIRDLLRGNGDYPILQQIIGLPFAIYISLLAAECFRRLAEVRGRTFARPHIQPS